MRHQTYRAMRRAVIIMTTRINHTIDEQIRVTWTEKRMIYSRNTNGGLPDKAFIHRAGHPDIE